MAFLAWKIPVLAHLPCLEGFLHHVAGRAELRIFFGIYVIPVAYDTARHRNQQQQQDDRLLVLFDEAQTE